MRITLQHRHDAPQADLGDAVARRALRRLGRITDRIAGLAVSLVDLNGPKGGVDRQCQMEARLRDGRLLHVRARAADVGTALDAALHKLVRRILREAQRGVGRRRHALPFGRLAASVR